MELKTVKIVSGVAAAVFLILSFLVPRFFLQFLIMGAVLLWYFLCNCHSSDDLDETRKIIELHNELMKRDIDLLEGEDDDKPMN